MSIRLEGIRNFRLWSNVPQYRLSWAKWDIPTHMVTLQSSLPKPFKGFFTYIYQHTKPWAHITMCKDLRASISDSWVSKLFVYMCIWDKSEVTWLILVFSRREGSDDLVSELAIYVCQWSGYVADWYQSKILSIYLFGRARCIMAEVIDSRVRVTLMYRSNVNFYFKFCLK